MGKVMLGDDLMFPSDYMAWEEFKGKEVTLTFKTISKEDLRKIDGSSERKAIATFVETPKKLVMNKTRGGQAAEALGSEQALDWIGKRIALYPGKYKNGTNMICCKKPKEKAHKPASDPGPAPATEQRLPVTEQESPQPQAASGSVPKANRDIAESIATQDTEPVLADVGRVADLLGVDMDDERWSRLISQGSIRAAINTMLDEVE